MQSSRLAFGHLALTQSTGQKNILYFVSRELRSCLQWKTWHNGLLCQSSSEGEWSLVGGGVPSEAAPFFLVRLDLYDCSVILLKFKKIKKIKAHAIMQFYIHPITCENTLRYSSIQEKSSLRRQPSKQNSQCSGINFSVLFCPNRKNKKSSLSPHKASEEVRRPIFSLQ